MAGLGSRFSKAGYIDPKPLIKIHNIPMIRLVIENLKPNITHRFIFITQREHHEKYNLETHLKEWAPGCEILILDGLTEGAACTVLAAKHFINNHDPLMIANSDQYIDVNINDYLSKLEHSDNDGLIMTMSSSDPKWSFVDVCEQGFAKKVIEKEVISNEATVGIYNFKHGYDFIDAAETMISNNERVNGEFYVAPVYNNLIKAGLKIGIHNVGQEANGMYGLGIPDDLKLFLSMNISLQATDGILT